LVNVNNKKILLQTLKSNYNLCKYCLKRHIPSVKLTHISDQENCFICHGMMNNIDVINTKILSTVNNVYEFDSFLIGATIPTEYYEREDQIRAKFKIRGKENIKIQLIRELRKKFLKITKSRLDFLMPDISINISIDKNNNVEVIARTRPLHFFGRYLKKHRGIRQRQTKCISCQGKGCLVCDYSGLSGYDSIEGIIAKRLISITEGQNPKFTWVGSEDEESIVLGKGRPFFASISNPRIRKLENNFKFSENGILVTLRRKSDNVIECDRALTKSDIENIKVYGGSIVKFETKSRQFSKRIYSLRIQEIDSNHFAITVITDGGFQVKQFIGEREYAKPNISDIFDSDCRCISFDILDVDIQKHFF
jgi:tRNA pseudouridine synthase 10